MTIDILKPDIKMNVILISVLMLICLANVFYIPRDFIDQMFLPKMLWLSIVTSCFFVLYISISSKIYISKIVLYFVGIVLYMLFYALLKDRLILPQDLFPFSLIMILLMFQNVNLGNSQILLIHFIVSISAILIAILGILQFFDLFAIFNKNFKVTGTFDNPAGFAGYLVVTFPFIYQFVFYKKSCFQFFGCVFSILLTVMIIVSNSRSGILSLIVILLFFTQQESTWYKRVWIKYRWVIIILGVSLLIMLYLWKKDSANGRFLIWHCSLEMIKERPILGHGPHAFQAEYMLYQAKYLDEYKNHKYAFLANNVKQPFNEFIKIIVEYGLLGGFVFIAWCYYLFKLYLSNPRANRPYFASLVGIGVFSCFSYPLIYPSIKFLVFFNVVMILKNNSKYDFSLKLSRFMTYACIVCSLIYFSYVVYWKRIAYKWYNITLYSVSYSPEVMLPYYQKYYAELSSQWIFLYNYGELLAMSGFYGESIVLQKECVKRSNNMDMQLNIANNYIQLGEFSKAEECLILASSMCPSRFVPLFELFKLYQKTNKKVKAIEYANLILNKDVKVLSPLIIEIKSSVEKFLEYEDYDRK